MTAKLAAEWRKLATTRTFYWLLAGTAAVAAVGAFSTTSATTEMPWHMTQLHGEPLWLLAAINASIFAVIMGARVFTDEFRHSTIAHTYIADPRRRASTIAKAVVAAVSGILVGAVAVAALLLVALAMALSSNGQTALHSSDLIPTVGLLAGMGLWAVVGAGLGAIVRNQVAVVAVGLIWILMLENLGAGLLEGGGRFLPGQAVQAMAQTGDTLGLLGPGPGAGLMTVYSVMLTAASLAITRRRDIT